MIQIAFRLGLLSRREVIDWADSRIRQEQNPEYEVIELALLGDSHAQTIIGKLEELSGNVDQWSVLPSVFSRFVDNLRTDPSIGAAVATGLWSMYTESDYDVPSEFSFASSLDEDYYLARSGIYGKESEITASLIKRMEDYQDDA